jgi:hypothetical protein
MVGGWGTASWQQYAGLGVRQVEVQLRAAPVRGIPGIFVSLIHNQRVSEQDSDDDQELLKVYERLNRQFYTAEPHRYFERRWLTLVLLARKPDDLAALLADDAQQAHLQISPQTLGAPGGHNDYVAMESEVLLHQASETLLRLFLAHWGTDGCPWLDIAAERTPKQFKDRVEAEIVDTPSRALREATHGVFLDGARRPDSIASADWESALDNLASFLRYFARRWLDDAPLYNSLKHGLSAVPGAVQAAWASEPDLSDAQILGRGLSVDYLDFEKVAPKRRAWKQVTKWLDVEESLALAQVAYQMIQSLWAIGRARSGDGPMPRRGFLPIGLIPSSFRSQDRAPMRHMTVPLFLEEQL